MPDPHTIRAPTPSPEGGHAAATTILAAGAFLAAFGVASCCALPLALGALGIGSTALLAIAVMVGPYEIYVLAVAATCLIAAAVLLWRQRRARIRGVASPCRRSVLDHIGHVAIVLALGLIALTFWMEPPI